MANLDLEPVWKPGIRRIDIGDPVRGYDPVQGGSIGPQNEQAVDIGDRTEWLKGQLETIAPVVDTINGEVVPASLADKLGYLQGTKEGIKDAMEGQGIEIPPAATFRDYAAFIEGLSVEGREVTNVSNMPWHNPGTGLGGITWDDPMSEFNHLELTDLANPQSAPVEIAPGVRRFEPPAGTRQYKIRTVFSNGTKSAGVTLPSTAYSIVYTANLVSVTIPLANPRQMVLVFDNFISAASAAGFTVTGFTDTLAFVDQPDNKSLRLQLANKVFAQGQGYTLNYNGAGTLKTSDNAGVPAWTGYNAGNYSNYSPAQFVSAEIPQGEPSSLVIVMSRAVKNVDYARFSLPAGTTAAAAGLVSPTGAAASMTIHLSLNEPADAAETGVRLSMQAGGAVDDYGQAVAAFSNAEVSNNSGHTAIGANSAVIPSNAPDTLRVIMEGAVRINGAASGTSAPPGWSLAGAGRNLGAWAISDGTITFQLSGNVTHEKTPSILYNGSDPTFKAVATGDTIAAFSKSVTNNSTQYGGIPAGNSPRNLGTVIFGRNPVSVAEAAAIFEAIHETIAEGNVGNLVEGDYFHGHISASNPFTVAAGYDEGGAINMIGNPDLGDHGKYMTWVIAGRNSWKNTIGNNYDHVAIQSKNMLGYGSQAGANGHYMNPDNTNIGGYKECKMRQYLLNNMLPALQAIGVPFDEEWMKAPERAVGKGGTGSNPGYDIITDKLFLPTEYEMTGAYTSSNSQAEPNQGRLAYYANNTDRLKYNKENVSSIYRLASSSIYDANSFSTISTNGESFAHVASNVFGVAPVLCVA
jgi:hypothetical protein